MNIDKELEKVKEFMWAGQNIINATEYENQPFIKITQEDIEALENLVSFAEDEGVFVIRNLKTREELETYKKIAEKLALTILEIDVEEKDVYETICKSTPNNRCEEFGNGNCTECIIDWARKEVEK